MDTLYEECVAAVEAAKVTGSNDHRAAAAVDSLSFAGTDVVLRVSPYAGVRGRIVATEVRPLADEPAGTLHGFSATAPAELRPLPDQQLGVAQARIAYLEARVADQEVAIDILKDQLASADAQCLNLLGKYEALLKATHPVHVVQPEFPANALAHPPKPVR